MRQADLHVRLLALLASVHLFAALLVFHLLAAVFAHGPLALMTRHQFVRTLAFAVANLAKLSIRRPIEVVEIFIAAWLRCFLPHKVYL